MSIRPRSARVVVAALAATALSTLAVVAASPAAARTAPSVAHRDAAQPQPHTVPGTCYTQTAGTGAGAAPSQTFTPDTFFDYSDSNSYGADDFTLTSGCHLTTIVIPGQYFEGSGPATSETVTIYKKGRGGVPGAVRATYDVVGVDSNGTFTLTIPQTNLRARTFWISVSANMPNYPGGQWNWETSAAVTGAGAVWKNPGNGFRTGCTTWTPRSLNTCWGLGSDFLFTLSGS